MNRVALDDAAVIEVSRAEPDRFASLFDRHAPYIHRYLARRVGTQAADDLVAETFLVAFRKRTGYDPRFPDARPWLYGIATNLIAQHRREEARQFRLRQAAGPAPVAHDWAERSVANVTAQSLRVPLARALARLARPDRDVLLLVAWEQLRAAQGRPQAHSHQDARADGRAGRHGAVYGGADVFPGHADDGGRDGALPGADSGDPAE